MEIARTQDEIDGQLNGCAESADKGVSRWPGMTYEQGVEAGIRWILGETDDAPIEEE